MWTGDANDDLFVLDPNDQIFSEPTTDQAARPASPMTMAAATYAPPPNNIRTLTQLAHRYIAARAPEINPRTTERNGYYAKRWVQALGLNCLLTDLTPDRLLTTRTKLLAELSPVSVNCLMAFLKSLLIWASIRDIPVHPGYKLIRKLHTVRPRIAWWTTDEVAIALDAAATIDAQLSRDENRGQSTTARLLIAIGCLSGLRYEELIMLRWEDLELDRLDGRTKSPAPVAYIVPRDGWVPKDRESRTVPLHMTLVEIIRPYRQREGWILTPLKAMPKRGGTKRVYRYDPKKIWNMVLRQACTQGAKRITPNGMRHSFASNLLMAGVSDVLVSRWLGHATTAMVHKHYGHLLSYHPDINRMDIGIDPRRIVLSNRPIANQAS